MLESDTNQTGESNWKCGAFVAMTHDRVIGLDGGLPWHYSQDLKRFKRLTMGYTIIMGRKTWESIGSKPLPKRRNIVISRYVLEGVETYRSIEAALEQCPEPVWIIGGGQIYAAALDYIDMIDITWVPDQITDPVAVRFPVLDLTQWQASEIKVNDEDSRLTHQRFIRKTDQSSYS